MRLGTGTDLRLYHNGTNSYIENYTGNLYIFNASNDRDIHLQTDDGSGGSTDYIFCDGSTGEVVLSHYGNTKLATTTTGINVTGTLAATAVTGSGSGLTGLTGASAGTYGASNITPVITVDSNGRITGISTVDTAGGGGGGGGISNLSEDTTPQLGDLDMNGNDITSNVNIVSTDSGSVAAPELSLYRNSSSPAAADYIGQIKFQGESSSGATRLYAKITGKIGDPTNGSEDGTIEIAHRKNGSNNISARWNQDELQLINGTELSLGDSQKISFGTGDDVDIYHDGNDGYFRNATGQLLVRGNDIKLQSYLGETYATFANNGAASLYYDNALKFATTSDGATITGELGFASGGTYQLKLSDNQKN